MSLFKRRNGGVASLSALEQITGRPILRRNGTANVTTDSAMRMSAVWACLRQRADLISTMPIDVFRRVGEVQVEMPKPPVLVNPGGERVDLTEWMYSSQVDLDRAGNCIGLITEVNAFNLPSRIDLQPLAECSVRVEKGQLRYRVAGKSYEPHQVWHEKQFTLPGLEVGLSPVAYAAMTIGEYQSIQQFALDWFGDGTIPAAHLRNTQKKVNKDEAAVVKDRFKAAVSNRDLFVTGNDWEYKMIQAEQASAAWIEAKQFAVSDIARFFGVPGDLIDAAVTTGNITYANVTQRNLQFLIMQLGPAITRRERMLSKLLPRPRYVKLNTDAILRMDPQTRATVDKTRIESRTLTPDGAREHDNLPPLSEADYAQYDRLFGPPRANPSPTSATGVTS